MQYSKQEQYLMSKDAQLKEIIISNKHIKITRPTGNYYDSLINLVISQFISRSAAISISNKLLLSFNANIFKEEFFENLTYQQIHRLGLTKNKAKSIKDITYHFINEDFRKKITSLPMKEFDRYFLSIYGLGPWSLNMFKLFSLGDEDIFSSNDAALRRAMETGGMLKLGSDHKDFDLHAMKWKPFRSTASLHLWRSLD
jgi:DNA-3-methyladenine glycosylase II